MSERLLSDPYKIEFINGFEVVAMARPSSNHYVVSSNIYHLFNNFLRGKTCRAFSDGIDVYFDDGNILVPDFFVLCDRGKWKRDGIHGAPDLAVEVLSPSTEKYDRGDKKRIYEANGVKEYWLADPDNKKIEVYLLKDGRYDLDEVYRVPAEYEKDEDKQRAKTVVTPSLFDDLPLDLNDIFMEVDSWSD
jgi:Uma2 family endonuclease